MRTLGLAGTARDLCPARAAVREDVRNVRLFMVEGLESSIVVFPRYLNLAGMIR
jgi:hypothetical protein